MIYTEGFPPVGCQYVLTFNMFTPEKVSGRVRGHTESSTRSLTPFRQGW